MDLVKVGQFIKDLRKEKGDTQEELASKFYVSRRTVSRWETGANLPDIDILIDLADYFNVDLREILNGGKNNNMDNETKELAKEISNYKDEKFKRTKVFTLVYLFIGMLALSLGLIFDEIGNSNEFLWGFLKGMTFGSSFFSMLLAVLYITGVYDRFAKIMCKRSN